MCGKTCRDLSSDPNHCGACGHQIDRDAEHCCDGEPTAIDAANCAACGDACGPDDVCCGPKIGCAAACEPDDGGACVPADTCAPNSVDLFCAVSDATCAVVSAACGSYVNRAGGTVSVPSVACQVDADCASLLTLTGSPSGLAICAHGNYAGVSWLPSLDGSGSCAIAVTNGNNC